jgi:hypothetical protein
MSRLPQARRLFRAANRAVARFACSEAGAAQTISFLMVTALYLIVFFAILETCLFLAAKTGTTYAAFAGARAAAVRGEDPRSADRVRHAAVLAFAPFAGSLDRTSAATPAAGEEEFLAAYRAAAAEIGLPGDGLPRLRRQYRIAQRALTVESSHEVRGRPWDEDVTVSVTYEFPFTFPVVGRIMGRQGANGRFVFPVRSSATLPMEHPANDQKKLGIAHASF